MPEKIAGYDFDDLVQRYQDGASILELSKVTGCDRSALTRRFRLAGVRLRTISEALALAASKMTPEQRLANSAAAHAAVRGSRRPLAQLIERAAHNEVASRATALEEHFAERLRLRGIITVPQQAVGPYNCDLGAFPVAVEIFGGYWHFYGRHGGRLGRRLRWFFEAGWHILIVQSLPFKGLPLTDQTADHVVAHHKELRGLPTSRREYRMIRGTGELRARGTSEDDEATIVKTLKARK